MRIGFFSEYYFPETNGVVYSIETFRRELEKLGHEVYIFAPAPSLTYKEQDPRVIRFPAIKGVGFEDYYAKLPWTPQSYKRARALNLDIIHIHTPSELGIFGMSLAIKDKLPLVHTYHTDLVEYAKHYSKALPGVLLLSQLMPALLGMPELYRTSIKVLRPERSMREWNERAVRQIIPMLLNLSDEVISPSSKIFDHLRDIGVTKPMSIIPTGVDPLKTNKSEATELAQKYGFSKDDKIICYVGRLAGEKNIELLILSLPEILKSEPHAKLLLVGDDAYRPKLEALVKQLDLTDKVTFTGYITNRSQLGAAYSLSKVFAFPSVTDTQGLVVLEAANAGLPLVLVDSGITEVMQDGKNGYVAKNNVKDMTTKLLNILNDDELQAKMSEASREIAKNFSAVAEAKKLATLYDELISSASS